MEQLRSVRTLAIAAFMFLVAFGGTNVSPAAADDGEASIKIVGGTEAAAGAWPSQVGLLTAAEPNNFQAQFCGGSLIQGRWVLTAAHCVDGQTANQIEVLTGTQDLGSGGVRRDVSTIVMHPSYSSVTFANDFALLELATEAPDPLMPIMGPNPDEKGLITAGTNSIVTGWGQTEGNPAGTPPFPEDLRQATVPIVSDATCAGSYGASLVANVMLCAGLATGGLDSCQGDSGGPLMVADPVSGVFIQVGVVSWGDGCADPSFYGVYAEVHTAYCWVHDTIAAAGYDFINSGLTNVGFETGNSCAWDTTGTPLGKAGKVITDAFGVNSGTFAASPNEGSFMGQLGTTYTNDGQNQAEGPNEMWQCFQVERLVERFVVNMHTFDYSGFDLFVLEVYDPETGTILQRLDQEAWGPSGDTSFKTTGWKPMTLNLGGHLRNVVCIFISMGGTLDDLFGSWLNIDSAFTNNPAALGGTPSVQSGTGSSNVNQLTGDVTILMPAGQKTPITVTVPVTCPDGSQPLSATLLLNGASFPMSETAPGSGFFTATIPAGSVVNGALTIQVNCNGTQQADDLGTIVLYDPSGFVTDSVTGDPIPGATVTLYQVPGWLPDTDTLDRDCESNDTPGHVPGVWTQAVNQATLDLAVVADPLGGLIDPTTNPQLTNAVGHYGWDVAQGCWFVHVSAYGYTPLFSSVVGVPPEVTDLDITLDPCACGLILLSSKSVNVPTYSVDLDNDDEGSDANLECDVDNAARTITCVSSDPLQAGGASSIFPLIQVPEGTWTMTASTPGAPNIVKTVMVASTAKAALDFKPTDFGGVQVGTKDKSVNLVTIVITDVDGDVGECDVAFIALTVFCSGGATAGPFPYINLPPGKYTFTTTPEGGAHDPSTQTVTVKAAGVAKATPKFTPDGALLEVAAKASHVTTFTIAFTEDGTGTGFGSCTVTIDVSILCDATATAAGFTPGEYPFIHFAGTVIVDVVVTSDASPDVTKDNLRLTDGKSTKLPISFKTDVGLLKVGVRNSPVGTFDLAFSDSDTSGALGSCTVVVLVSVTCDGTANGNGITAGAYPFIQFAAGAKVDITATADGITDLTKTGVSVQMGRSATFNLAIKATDGFIKLGVKAPRGVDATAYTVNIVSETGTDLGSCDVTIDVFIVCDATATGNGFSSSASPFIQADAAGLPATLTLNVDGGLDFKPISKTVKLAAGRTTTLSGSLALV